MADRGAVFRLKRRIGFGGGDQGEPVVVLQATSLNAALPTTIIVPLDLATEAHEGVPTVPVSGAEVGAAGDYVALPTPLRPIRADLLGARRGGAASAADDGRAGRHGRDGPRPVRPGFRCADYGTTKIGFE
jgi:hypothetical protein